MPELLDIVGQDQALAQLQRALAGGRRPHAYIFAGPEGVGRRTTAVELGRLLLCAGPVSRPNAGRLSGLPADHPLAAACGRCDPCRTVTAGINADFLLVEKELARYHEDPKVRERKMQALGIDVIRDFLIKPAYRAPAGGRGKVFVVREADLMSNDAQGALLKTLEEPPAGVTIILICPSPAALLPTTRSRCQLVRFVPLPAEYVAGALTRAGVGAGEAAFWAAFTGGSLGRSQRLAGEGLYEFKRRLVDRLAGLTGAGAGGLAEMLVKAAEEGAKRHVKRDKDLAVTVATRRAGEGLLELIASVYRDALAAATGARRAPIHADQAAAVAALATRFGPEALAEVLSAMAEYERLLWRNVGAKLLWDNVAATCAGAPLEAGSLG